MTDRILWEGGDGWRLVSDKVMGGRSSGRIETGHEFTRLTGEVSLENDGGFLQIALDLPEAPLDARASRGVALQVRGNGAEYNLHVRTPQIERPWQSWRATFIAPSDWTRVEIPFDALTAHRIDAAPDLSRLTRIGLVAIGRAFHADLSVASVALYSDTRA